MSVAIVQGVRVVLLALWLVVSARLLEPDGYGHVLVLTSLGAVVSALLSSGPGMVMYEAIVRGHIGSEEAWRIGLRRLIIGIPFAVALYAAVAVNFFAISDKWVLVLVAAADVVAAPVIALGAFRAAAGGAMVRAALLPALFAFGRLLGLAVFWLTGTNSVVVFLVTYAAGSLVGVLLALIAVRGLKAMGDKVGGGSEPGWRQGLQYAINAGAGTALTSIDKSLVGATLSNEWAGLYGAAYRVVATAMLPIEAILMTAMPRLFQGRRDMRHGVMIKTLFAAAIVFGLIACFVIWSLAPMVVLFFGEAYAQSVVLIHAFAPLVLAYSLRLIGANVLMTLNARGLRIGLEVSAALLMMAVIPSVATIYGAVGAAVSVVMIEFVLAIALWASVVREWKRRRDFVTQSY